MEIKDSKTFYKQDVCNADTCWYNSPFFPFFLSVLDFLKYI